MFAEPVRAHPAEMGAVHAARHTHSEEDDDRDRRDDQGDDEQHRVRRNRVLSRRIAIVARPETHCLCACAPAFERVNSVGPRQPSALPPAEVSEIAAAYVCTREQRSSPTAAYASGMQLVSLKTVLATVWVSAALIAGTARNLTSVTSWNVLAGIAVITPIVMMSRWNAPPQTMSESIQEARR